MLTVRVRRLDSTLTRTLSSPPMPVEHVGSRASYQAGCRCLPCRAASAAYMTRYRGARARGRRLLGQLVDATPTMWRLRRLVRAGLTYADIARRLGLRTAALHFARRQRVRLSTACRVHRLARTLLE